MSITGPWRSEYWTWICDQCGKTGRGQTKHNARVNANRHWLICHGPRPPR